MIRGRKPRGSSKVEIISTTPEERRAIRRQHLLGGTLGQPPSPTREGSQALPSPARLVREGGFQESPSPVEGRVGLQPEVPVSKRNLRAGHRGPLGLVNRAVCSQSVLVTQALANPRGTRLRAILRNAGTRPPHSLSVTPLRKESHTQRCTVGSRGNPECADRGRGCG